MTADVLTRPRQTLECWRSHEQLQAIGGGSIQIRRHETFVEIDLLNGPTRFGPVTLRSLARVLLLAADDIDRELDQ